jgi:hypothetical protein
MTSKVFKAQRFVYGHLEIRKMKIKTQIYLIWLNSVFEKTMVKYVIYLLFSYQTGYIM